MRSSSLIPLATDRGGCDFAREFDGSAPQLAVDPAWTDGGRFFPVKLVWQPFGLTRTPTFAATDRVYPWLKIGNRQF